jgi:hypothetical protein
MRIAGIDLNRLRAARGWRVAKSAREMIHSLENLRPSHNQQ